MRDQRLNVEAIKRRADAARPGPWVHQSGRGIEGELTVVLTEDGDPIAWASGCSGCDSGYADPIDPADAAFIAHARQDIPALLDRITALAVALPPSARLRSLATWLDEVAYADDVGPPERETADDLRRWADGIDATLANSVGQVRLSEQGEG